ncbi:hypothetical protein BDW66DRAFT_142370 [Aspergillus desertorum]
MPDKLPPRRTRTPVRQPPSAATAPWPCLILFPCVGPWSRARLAAQPARGRSAGLDRQSKKCSSLGEVASLRDCPAAQLLSWLAGQSKQAASEHRHPLAVYAHGGRTTRVDWSGRKFIQMLSAGDSSSDWSDRGWKRKKRPRKRKSCHGRHDPPAPTEWSGASLAVGWSRLSSRVFENSLEV